MAARTAFQEDPGQHAMLRFLRLYCLFVCLFSFSLPMRADTSSSSLLDSLPKNLLITSMCRGLDGSMWVGTEDNGIYHVQPGNKVMQFTSKDGIGQDNDIYALCCDRLGRIWAGTLRSGVAVYNGKEWKTYGLLDGPLGSRVFALAVSPLDGDVWISTEVGLARYSEPMAKNEIKGTRNEVRGKSKTPPILKSHLSPTLDSGLSTLASHSSWSYYTRAEGLPSDQAQALTFGQDGSLYVGSQCDGIAIGSAKDDYKTWKVIKGADALPLANAGEGLPSNLINCMLVTKKGRVYAGTTAGLAWSDDKGETWRYLRGADWKAKVEGLYAPEGATSPAAVEAERQGDLLLEDYTTCLAETPDEKLWIGHRQKGVEAKDRKTFFRDTDRKTGTSFVKSFQITEKELLAGTYGEGMQIVEKFAATPVIKKAVLPVQVATPAFPQKAVAVTPDELKVLLQQATAPKDPIKAGEAAYLGEDWQTRGDWVGRYGKELAVLAATDKFGDDTFFFPPFFNYHTSMGIHHALKDSLRYWVHWLNTDKQQTLYNPALGLRRQAEWDDHGEAYPMSYEGPDIWVDITVPEGLHRISLYFFNKDGHEGDNRFRDYRIDIRQYFPKTEDALQAKKLAECRLINFSGGVYKQFVVTGPYRYVVRVRKNNSLNTICSGIFVNRLQGPRYITDQEYIPWVDGVKVIPDQPKPSFP